MQVSQLTGTVVGIFDPVKATDGARFLTVQADVIDSEKLKEVDFSKNNNQLPMVPKEYEVRADNNTRLDKGTLKNLKPGSLIYVETAENIYSGDKLSALSISVISQPK